MQVQNNKEEVPFAHYEEKFASLDPQEAAMRCGVPFENDRFTVTLLGTAYQIDHFSPRRDEIRRGRAGRQAHPQIRL